MILLLRLFAVTGIILSSITAFSQTATIQEKTEIMVVDPELIWELNWPLDRQIFQQNSSSQATFSISGQFSHTTASSITIEYSIDNLSLQTGAVVSSYSGWTTLPVSLTLSGKNEKIFLQNLTIPKGWYRLNLRAKYGSTVWSTKNIKFGVGDVYIIAGQSNAAGFEWNTPSDPTFDDSTLQPFANYSDDYDAVSRIGLLHGTASDDILQSIKGMPLATKFSQLQKGDFINIQTIYPNGRHSWNWSYLGKRIAAEKGTPVIFFNTAVPGSEISQWKSSSNQVNKRFRGVLQMYGSLLGTRGVLWHQGENDAEYQSKSGQYLRTDFGYYYNDLKTVIESSRNSYFRDNSNGNLNWFVSNVSYYSYPFDPSNQQGYNYCYYNDDPPASSFPFSVYIPSPLSQNNCNSGFTNALNYNSSLVDAQYNLYGGSTAVPGVKKGVFTDDLGVNSRSPYKKIHFSGSSLNTLGDRWYSAIYDSTGAPVGTANPGKTLTNLASVSYSTSGNGGLGFYTLNAPTSSGRKYFWCIDNDGIEEAIGTNSSISLSNMFESNVICYYSDDYDADNATNGWDLRLSATAPFHIKKGAKFLTSSQDSYQVTGTAGIVTVVAENTNWYITNLPSWITVSSNSTGGSGSTNVGLSLANNPSSTTRTATIKIQESGGAYFKNISISQSGSEISLTSMNQYKTVDWGNTMANRFDGKNVVGNAMTLNGFEYNQGIGTHAISRIKYELPGGYNYFTGIVGRDGGANGCNCGTQQVQFRILLNGNTVYNVTKTLNQVESFSIPLSGGPQTLELWVDDGGDNNWGDWADWVCPTLTNNPFGGCAYENVSPPSSISASPPTIISGSSSTLTASCPVGDVNWDTGATSNSINVTPSQTTIYHARCVLGSSYSSYTPVTVTVTGSGSGCSMITNNLEMGIWNVTGDTLISRSFHNSFWLTQKVNVNGSSYDEFVVRGSQMLQRTDIALNNSSYSSLVGCYAWQYSGAEGLVGPDANTNPAFPNPSGYQRYIAVDGTPYYSNFNTTSGAITNGNCYRIKTLANNNYLTAVSGDFNEFQSGNSGNNKIWKFTSSDNMNWKITSGEGSGKFLYAEDTFCGAKIKRTTNTGQSNQLWKFDQNGSNFRFFLPNGITWDHEGAGTLSKLQVCGDNTTRLYELEACGFRICKLSSRIENG